MIKIFLLCLSIVATSLTSGHSQSNQELANLFNVGIADSIDSKILGENRALLIHLPENYNPAGNQKYPVLYLLDGDVHLNAIATILAFQVPAYIPEMIVVGISNANNRTRDLTTSVVEKRHGRSVAESGGAKAFTEFIEKELIAYVDNNYLTTPYKTLIGHSYAGLFTINMLHNHSHIFDNYIAIDPSIDWDSQKLLKQIKTGTKSKNLSRKSFYLTIANEIPRFSDELDLTTVINDTSEFSLNIRSQLELVEHFETQNDNIAFTWKYYEKEIHGTVPLISFYDALRHLFSWYEIKTPSKFNDPSTPIEELIILIEDRTKLLTEKFGYPVYAFDEELLNMLGYMYMDMGQIKKSKAFFDLNIQYYPLSANVYDSMVDYYLSIENKDQALEFANKALEISNSDLHKKRIEEIKEMVKVRK